MPLAYFSSNQKLYSGTPGGTPDPSGHQSLNALVDAINALAAGFTAPFASPPPIGNVTPSTASFTTLGATGATTLSGGGTFTGTYAGNHTYSGALTLSAASTALSVTNAASLGSLTVNPGGTNPWTISGTTLQLTGTGSPNAFIKVPNSGALNFQTGTGGTALTVGATSISVPAAIKATLNGVVESKLSTQTTSTRTYTAGSTIGTAGPNYPVLWIDNTLNGTLTTGSSVAHYLRCNDAVNITSSNSFPIMTMDQELNSGFDGDRYGLYVRQQKNVASLTGSAFMTSFFLAGFWQGAEGGTGGASTGNWKGGGLVFNPDATCDIAFAQLCRNSEFDVRARQQPAFKNNITLNYGITDAAHGYFEDTAFLFTCSPTIAPGTGRGVNLIQFGSYSTSWPLDPTIAATGAGTSLIRAVMNTSGNQASASSITHAATTDTGYGVDYRVVNFATAAFTSPGFRVNPTGSLNIGPGLIDFTSAGLSISATYVTEQTAVVSVAGTGYNNGDYVMDDVGGLWQVATVAGGTNAGVATLTLLKAGFRSAAPGGAVAMTGGYGSGCTATITCSSAASAVTIPTGTSLTITAAGPTFTSGSGVPATTTPKGSIYLRTGGGVGTTLYVSQGGGTWNAVAGV